MKKFYMLIAAAGLAAFSANADLHFYINGEEVASGSRVDISRFYEDQIFQYMVNPHFSIKTDESGAFSGTVTLKSGESIPELDADWTVGAQVNVQWCAINGQCDFIAVGQSKTKTGSLTGGKDTDMELEISGMYSADQDPETLGIKAECDFECTFGGKDYTLTLFVDHDPAGVNDITFDANAPIEYYDLQGRRVNNPTNGLYIMRQGNKVVKSFIK